MLGSNTGTFLLQVSVFYLPLISWVTTTCFIMMISLHSNKFIYKDDLSQVFLLRDAFEVSHSDFSPVSIV